jgi:hypothetical protein
VGTTVEARARWWRGAAVMGARWQCRGGGRAWVRERGAGATAGRGRDAGEVTVGGQARPRRRGGGHGGLASAARGVYDGEQRRHW